MYSSLVPFRCRRDASYVVLQLCLCYWFAIGSSSEVRTNASTCADLATDDTYDLSFEGSWSYRKLDPQHAPLSTGEAGRKCTVFAV